MRMIDVVRKIPSDSQRLIQSFDKIRQDIGEKLDEDYEEIVLIGSGSSYNAAFLTQEFGEEVLHKKIRLYYPNVFNYHTNKEIFSEKTLFIFISQSGYTYLVHEAMKKVKNWGFSTLAITEDANSPIAQEALLHVDIMTGGEPYIFRTQGFTLTAITLYLTYLSLAKLDMDSQIQSLPERIESEIALAEKHYQEYQDVYRDAESFIFAGAGVYWPVVQEANIKFMEMLPELTASFELEEMIHGPQNSFKSSYHYFLLAEKEEDRIRAQQIANFIQHEVGAKVELFKIDKVDAFDPIVKVSYFQVLAYYIASDRKRDLTQATYPNIKKYIARKKGEK